MSARALAPPCPCGGDRRARTPSCSVRVGHLGRCGGRTRPSRRRHHRALRQRLRAVAMDGVRGLGEDQHVGAHAPSAGRDAAAGAFISASASRSSSSAEYQPETQAKPQGLPAPPSARSGSRGNLWPSSMPSKPAALASARQASSGVSPPSSLHDRRSTSRWGWRRCELS